MSELAAAASVPRSTMTGVIDRMEERGLVRTAPNPLDARSIVAALTIRGRAVVERLRDVERALDEKIGEVLDEDEATQLTALLERLAAAFSTSP